MDRITPSRIPVNKPHTYVRSGYQPGGFSELRQRVLQREKNKEQSAFLINKLTKHSVIIRKGTTFLIIFSVVALFTAVYLVHMESVDRHVKSPVSKGVK